ncbi:MAG: L,D-transpeptidase family protein [Bacteroidota bacterium]|nr:L,D-transpeptidase family protein [Bacteroidota bacterium]
MIGETPLLMSLRRRPLILFGLLAFGLCSGCDTISQKADALFSDNASGAPPEVSYAANDAQGIDAQSIAPQLRKLFAVDRVRAALVHGDTLLRQYRARDFRPYHISENLFPTRVLHILRYFMHAGGHGLHPDWYHASALQRLLDRVLTGEAENRPETLAEIDLLLSDGLLSYASHVRYGVFDPTRIDPGYHLPVTRPGLREFLEPLDVVDIAAYLRNIQPRAQRYHRLQEALREYRAMRLAYDWPRIPELTVDKVEAGDTSSVLPAVAHRLMLTGELFGSGEPPMLGTVAVVDIATQAFQLDSTRLARIGPIAFDSTLVRAVRRYQARHGLLVDGIIGSRTVGRMNRDIDGYIEQMEMNLERFRWLRYPERGRYIVVNIPDYWLNGYEDGEVAASMAVCVGERKSPWYADQLARYHRTRARRHQPKDHETPQLHGEFTHFILNPIWNVPGSIASRELYFSALKDSSFLQKKRYKVYYRDSVVDASSIDWSSHNPYSMPYKFKQEPGAGNALGAIKFMFPNDFSIYLHDTPQQFAFRRAVRAVSHGCVRIEEPMEFAQYLLRGTPEWDVGRIKRTIWSGTRSKPVFLHQKTPLYIDYVTAWVDRDGLLQLRDDIYRKDAALAAAMKRYDRKMRKL